MDWGEGAGFINDSIAEDPRQVTGSVSLAGDDNHKSLTAVSVSKVCKLTRPNDGLILHQKKLHHLHLVGYVYEIVDMNATKIHFLLDDHSGGGPLEVSYIFGDNGTPSANEDTNPEAQTKDVRQLEPGDYVRLIGVVNYRQDKASFVAYSIAIIDDPNVISVHILEVIRDSLYLQKLQANGGTIPQSVIKEEKPAMQQAPGDFGNFGKLSTRDKHVLTFLKGRASDTGIHIDEICKNFTGFKRHDIVESLTLLSNEGLCWQSDAEDVWCVD